MLVMNEWMNENLHIVHKKTSIKTLGYGKYSLGHLLKNTTEAESWKLVVGRLHSTRNRPDASCILACFQTRCVWPKPDQSIQVRSRQVLHNMIHAFFGWMELNLMWEVGSSIYSLARFWLHAGHDSHNKPSPKRFQIGSGTFTGESVVLCKAGEMVTLYRWA